MIRHFFRSPYVRAACAFIISGAILIMLYNVLRNTHLADGIEKINEVLMPVYIGVFLAFLLCPIYNKVVRYTYGRLKAADQRSGAISTARFGTSVPASFRDEQLREYARCLRISKIVATLVCMTLLIGFFALIGYFVLPQLMDSVINLINTMPSRLNTLSEWSGVHLRRFPQVVDLVNSVANAGTTEVIAWIQMHVFNENFESIAAELSNRAMQVVLAFKDIFIGILISVYLLNYKEKIFANGRKIVAATCSEKKSRSLYEFCGIINETFIGFIVGRILDALVIGVLTYLSMLALGMPLPLLVSTIVGVTNVIPFFGPFIGAIPSFCLLMLEDPMQACYFVLLILVIQQLDGNLIGPKIVGNAIGIGSFWVLIAVLIGGGLFGFIGMALGVPVFAVIYKYIAKVTNNRLKKKDKEADVREYLNYGKFGIKKEELFGDEDTDTGHQ